MSVNTQKRHDTRTLIVVRHAEADWGMDDFNRQLTRRGHAQAQEVGRWLVENDLLPQMIVSSAALRTRQSTARICEMLGEKAPTASLDERLYNAPESALMAAVNAAPETVDSLLLVAHLPGVQDLAMQLMRPDSEYAASMEISYGFPPASVAVFDIEGSWRELARGQAYLKNFKTFSAQR